MLFDSIWKDLKWQYQYGSPLVKIIFINAFVFIILNLLSVIDYFAKTNFGSFTLELISFKASKELLYQPWSILTYQFTQVGFLHILFNMLWLHLFGSIVSDFIGKNKIVPLYIIGGFFGAILYSIISAILFFSKSDLYNANNIMYGASAGVMAVVLAAATLAPNYEIRLLLLGNVKIKWIALVTVILDIIFLNDGNLGGHLSHLGGAFFGWLFITQLRNGNDYAHKFYAIIDFFKNIFKKKPKMKVVYNEKKEKVYAEETKKQQHQHQKNTNNNRPLNKQEKQKQLDTILDKINSSGYDSLNKDEKDFLYQISKED
jgi:membrane associated rhomboid family serine protease